MLPQHRATTAYSRPKGIRAPNSISDRECLAPIG